jgi:hypothetical protein
MAATHVHARRAEMVRAVPVANVAHRRRELLAHTLPRGGLAQDSDGGVIVVSLERP